MSRVRLVLAASVALCASLTLIGCPKRDEPAPKGDDKSSANGNGNGNAASALASSSAAPLEVVGKRVDIDVGEHGFTPSEIHVKKGEPTTLVFTRTSNQTCAFDVVFPELDVKKDLPMKRPVAVVVPVDTERTLTFTCGMKMYKSSVIIQ